ncbi:DUF4097 family beta strand repeat-containing protein [Streptomyces armeniacus]|nr:DUF4097 family beta strand repeat-containing protein [Streptomyces armeniacus]
MHIFDTPAPIRAVLEIGLGDAWIIAGERDHTHVGVHPSDPCDPRDVTTAERTRVEYAHGRLLVMSPRPSGSIGTGGAVTAVIELPAGSSLHGHAAAADFRCEGRLGDCRLTSDYGHIRLDSTDALRLTADFGDVTVERARGPVDIAAHSGELCVREIDGDAVVRRTRGSTWIGEITGELCVQASDGPVSVGRAHAAVEARTGRGDIRIQEAVRGPVLVDTASGEVDIGIAEGAPSHLDATSERGTVYRSLDTFQATAGAAADAVRVRARSVSGDIVVRRSALP